jgi:hypothetical protein
MKLVVLFILQALLHTNLVQGDSLISSRMSAESQTSNGNELDLFAGNFGPHLKAHFPLEDGYTNLNHGSYGSTPHVVTKAAHEWQAQMEACPDKWFRQTVYTELETARTELANYVGADPLDLVFVENASHGIPNSQLTDRFRSSPLVLPLPVCDLPATPRRHERHPSLPRDLVHQDPVPLPLLPDGQEHSGVPPGHIWRAARRGVHHLPHLGGPHRQGPPHRPRPPRSPRISHLPTQPQHRPPPPPPQRPHPAPPPPPPQAVADALEADPDIGVASIDHITSCPAVVLPVRRIADACRRRGVPLLVDGAHALGHLPLDLSALGADFYVANAHKWLFAPKSAAVLWVRRDRQAGPAARRRAPACAR